MLHRVGLAPTISVHARGEVIAGAHELYYLSYLCVELVSGLEPLTC